MYNNITIYNTAMIGYTRAFRRDHAFFSDVYQYFTRGGYWCIFVENMLTIVITALTLAFVIFACFFMNWKLLGECQSEITCNSLSYYIVSPSEFHSGLTNVFMYMFMTIFTIYWLWLTITMINELFKFMKYRGYFKQIGIRTDELKVLSWNDVVRQMIQLDSTLTADIIVGSIMNKDNYLIAIVGANLFKINPAFYTRGFLWLINVGILNRIFDGNKRDTLYINAEKIKQSLRASAIFLLLASPFILILIVINYVIVLTTDIYTKKSYIGPKEWSLYAKLVFREYNELSHIFNERISKSYKYAVQYEQKFNAHMSNILMEKLIFVCGTYLTLLVIMTIYDETLLMYIKLFNRNLLWYVAILTSIISIARVIMVYPSSVDESSEEIMVKMAKYTHHYPPKWRNKCHKVDVLYDFRSLYKYKLFSVGLEIASVIIVPLYMLCKLGDDIDVVVDFIQKNTVYNDDTGHFCKLGITNINEIEQSELENDYDSCIGDEKIERSIKNFKSYYKIEEHESLYDSDIELKITTEE